MTESELTFMLQQHGNIEYKVDDEFLYFRNLDLPWYAKNPENATRITKEVFKRLTPDELLTEINRGLELEHITRITGYFTKISQWNKGKRGELKDRVRTGEV